MLAGRASRTRGLRASESDHPRPDCGHRKAITPAQPRHGHAAYGLCVGVPAKWPLADVSGYGAACAIRPAGAGANHGRGALRAPHISILMLARTAAGGELRANWPPRPARDRRNDQCGPTRPQRRFAGARRRNSPTKGFALAYRRPGTRGTYRACVRFIPVFSTAGVALSDARKAMSLWAAPGSSAPLITAAANTWTNCSSAGIVPTKSTPG